MMKIKKKFSIEIMRAYLNIKNNFIFFLSYLIV